LLVSCVNDTLTSALRTRSSGEPSRTGSRRRIVIVTRATESIYSYASYSLHLLAHYAAERGYTLFPLVADSTDSDYQYYRKLSPLLDVLRQCEGWVLPCEYVVWIDAGKWFI